MPLASVALAEARVLLNDQGAKLYKDTVILPILRKAYRELQQKLADNGVSVSREQSANINVAALATTITFGGTPALPATLLYPISLSEKLSGDPDTSFIPMTEKTWIETETQEQRLRFWDWREDIIHLIGSTVATVVRLRYWASLAAIADGTTNIPILDCETFLAARTASIAAFVIGGSTERAEPLQNDAEDALDVLLSRAVKNRQALPVRRRKFRPFRNRILYR